MVVGITLDQTSVMTESMSTRATGRVPFSPLLEAGYTSPRNVSTTLWCSGWPLIHGLYHWFGVRRQKDNLDDFQCLDIWMGSAMVYGQTDHPFLDDHLVVQLLHPIGEDGTVHASPVLVGVLCGKSVQVLPLKVSWRLVLPYHKEWKYTFGIYV